MNDSVADFDTRLRRLEDEQAIIRVLNKYAHCIDYGDEDGFLDCFTEDAVWSARNMQAGSALMRHEGHAALRAFASSHTRPPELYHKHLIAEPVLSVDGDTAEATSYLLLLVAGPGGLPAIASFGRYRDELRREAGCWRIATRVAEAEAWNPIWGELRNRRRERLSVKAGHVSG